MTAPDRLRELRATSDNLLRDLDVLAELEEQKRQLAADDPRLVETAERIRQIAARVLSLSTVQHELTERISVQPGQPGVDAPTIEDTPPRPVAHVLVDWRAAERRLAAAEEGSVDAAEAQALVDRYREEYRRAFEAADAR